MRPAVSIELPPGDDDGQASRDSRGTSAAAVPSPSAEWQALRIAAEIFSDFQEFRIAAVNRAQRGGVDPRDLDELITLLGETEKDLERRLRNAYRAAVPPAIREWQDQTKGLGEHTFGRLLGLLGHPRQAYPWHWEGTGSARHLVAEPPFERSIGQLWSYCGVGDPARSKRRRNMSAEEAMAAGSPRIRALLHVIAENCVKHMGGPYRELYEGFRAHYQDATHKTECVRCGPRGKPAQPGSPYSLGHQHAIALERVAKEILRDLWLMAAK